MGNKKESLGPFSGMNKKTMTLREEIHGRKLSGGGGPSNVKATLKMNHLQSLALWAGGEASIPSLAAFFGNRLATCGEIAGTPLDQSLFSCSRCETILQPGHNCTVRIEKNRDRVRRSRKKSRNPTQNDVIYTCHFCSNQNRKKGTPKGHVREILASKPKPGSERKSIIPNEQMSVSPKLAIESSNQFDKEMNEVAPSETSPPASKSNFPKLHEALVEKVVENSPVTPRTVLSEGKMRKNRSRSNKQVGTKNEPVSADSEKVAGNSSKKRRKSWTSLKEIAEKNELKDNSNVANLTVPYLMIVHDPPKDQ